MRTDVRGPFVLARHTPFVRYRISHHSLFDTILCCYISTLYRHILDTRVWCYRIYNTFFHEFDDDDDDDDV